MLEKELNELSEKIQLLLEKYQVIAQENQRLRVDVRRMQAIQRDLERKNQQATQSIQRIITEMKATLQ